MEWILWTALAVMLALLCYTIFWTSIVIRKKVQPVTDSFFDALELFVLSQSPRKPLRQIIANPRPSQKLAITKNQKPQPAMQVARLS